MTVLVHYIVRDLVIKTENFEFGETRTKTQACFYDCRSVRLGIGPQIVLEL